MGRPRCVVRTVGLLPQGSLPVVPADRLQETEHEDAPRHLERLAGTFIWAAEWSGVCPIARNLNKQLQCYGCMKDPHQVHPVCGSSSVIRSRNRGR